MLLSIAFILLIESDLCMNLVQQPEFSVITKIKLIWELIYDLCWIITIVYSDFFNVFSVQFDFEDADWIRQEADGGFFVAGFIVEIGSNWFWLWCIWAEYWRSLIVSIYSSGTTNRLWIVLALIVLVHGVLYGCIIMLILSSDRTKGIIYLIGVKIFVHFVRGWGLLQVLESVIVIIILIIVAFVMTWGSHVFISGWVIIRVNWGEQSLRQDWFDICLALLSLMIACC